MEEAGWKKTGLKCGLEIHQQLEGSKLFCNCKTIIREDEPHFTITRQLRAAAGEAGQVDIAAMQEMQKGRKFVYNCHKDTTCLVELDEMPPLPINEDALETGIQAAKLLKAKIVDNARVMRKTVVDGSNTAGFQRTALIALNGSIDSTLGPIGIHTLILEEDSCRILGENAGEVQYALDRLGIPLLEICTKPDIKTPEHCKEVAEKIGLLLRSTGRVKRGLGTIRQDVNISITGGNRVEIKGAQDLKMLPAIVELEVTRQQNLITIRDELAKRKAKKNTFKTTDVTQTLRNSGAKIIRKALDTGRIVLGTRLHGFAQLIGRQVQPNKRLGTEFSERAKVTAGVGGILHSDELPDYGITAREVELLRQDLGCLDNDAFVLVADKHEQAEKALKAVIERANEAIERVPCEVRKANSDGTTSYLRPMPGAARMYPETDIPPIRITPGMIETAELPELIEEKTARYIKMGLSKDLAELTARSEKAEMFDSFAAGFLELKPAYMAEILMTSAKTIKRNYGMETNPSEEDFRELFAALIAGQITKESVLDVLKENIPVAEAIHKHHTIPDTELRTILKKIVQENPGQQFNTLTGIAMKQLRGMAQGEKITRFLKALTG